MTAWNYDLSTAPEDGTVAWVAVSSIGGEPERDTVELAYWGTQDSGGEVRGVWCHHGTAEVVEGTVYAWTRAELPGPPIHRE